MRVCTVTVEIHGTRILLICAYMPFDDHRPNINIIDFNIALNDIVLNIFIHLPNSLKLITGSRLVRKYNLNTYK